MPSRDSTWLTPALYVSFFFASLTGWRAGHQGSLPSFHTETQRGETLPVVYMWFPSFHANLTLAAGDRYLCGGWCWARGWSCSRLPPWIARCARGAAVRDALHVGDCPSSVQYGVSVSADGCWCEAAPVGLSLSEASRPSPVPAAARNPPHPRSLSLSLSLRGLQVLGSSLPSAGRVCFPWSFHPPHPAGGPRRTVACNGGDGGLRQRAVRVLAPDLGSHGGGSGGCSSSGSSRLGPMALGEGGDAFFARRADQSDRPGGTTHWDRGFSRARGERAGGEVPVVYVFPAVCAFNVELWMGRVQILRQSLLVLPDYQPLSGFDAVLWPRTKWETIIVINKKMGVEEAWDRMSDHLILMWRLWGLACSKSKEEQEL